MKFFYSKLLLTSLVTGSMYFVPAMASAATAPADNAEMQEYNLGTVVLTATRTAKTALNTPASTVVLSSKQLAETGASNVQEALAKVQGISYKSFAPGGSAMGPMTNEVAIRGVKNGTLILINGAPMNTQGKYYLDAIPVDMVRRVEVIKGGSSVLYGSDAMAGVINIITKRDLYNSIKVGAGNYGQRDYQVQAGIDNFNVNYTQQRWGDVNHIMNSYATIKGKDMVKQTDMLGSKKESINTTYNINKEWNLLFNKFKTTTDYRTAFTNYKTLIPTAKNDYALQSIKHYVSDENYTQLTYAHNKLRGNLYFNQNHLTGTGMDYIESRGGKAINNGLGEAYNSDQKYTNYGLDLHKKWEFGDKKDSNIVGGIAYEHQKFDNNDKNLDVARKVYSIYSQYDKDINDKNEYMLGLRGTWSNGGSHDLNYHNLSASTAYIHKLDKEQSVYANIAQSFIMPTLNQMYGSGKNSVPNPGLKPQKGINYELGWKKKHNTHNWKVALFHIDIKDNISGKWITKKDHYEFSNEDFHNTGIEVSSLINSTKNVSYNWGVTYNNPMSKSSTKGYWDRMYGKWQLTGGVNYTKAKWTSSLQGSYFADRVTTPNERHSYKEKPYFLTSWTNIYKPDEFSTLTLAVNNVLNRRDNIGYTGTDLYTTPRNFELSYQHQF